MDMSGLNDDLIQMFVTITRLKKFATANIHCFGIFPDLGYFHFWDIFRPGILFDGIFFVRVIFIRGIFFALGYFSLEYCFIDSIESI